ncbi:MAG: hypothetical protein JOZ31_15905 [Verrucomicrobia bacterium]|nr:hypothetical protein [Verrucomicrobiota bacterium]
MSQTTQAPSRTSLGEPIRQASIYTSASGLFRRYGWWRTSSTPGSRGNAGNAGNAGIAGIAGIARDRRERAMELNEH